MPVYLVKRTDYVGWEEYIGAVVIADSAEKALEMLHEKHDCEDPKSYCSWGTWKVEIKEIDTTKPEIILEDYKSG